MKSVLIDGVFKGRQLQALIKEYELPYFIFDESCILTIEDDVGKPVEHAKSVSDQTHMANFITRTVYEITNQNNTSLHASIAGGRKTMAFYLGYAMSLFGRKQDTLSHVFVSDEFEFVRDFWYPTKNDNWIVGKYGQGEINTKHAVVTLAEIPFVRMRDSVDPALIQSMQNLSFSKTVEVINASHNSDITVAIHSSSRTISVLGRDISLTAREFAFL